jgi:hypothetical protein
MKAKGRSLVYASPQERKKARLIRKIARVRRQLAHLERNLATLLAAESNQAPAEEISDPNTLPEGVTKGVTPGPSQTPENTLP